jgi:hypothetical protein
MFYTAETTIGKNLVMPTMKDGIVALVHSTTL